MRILILSSLFPPDPGETALYVKELVERLSKDHSVTLLIYGTLPETVSGIKIHSIDKRRSTLVRMALYLFMLYRLSRVADRVIVQNSPATEFPVLITSVLTRRPYTLCTSDQTAFGGNRRWYDWIHARAVRGANTYVPLFRETDLWKKPEWLPYKSVDLPFLARREEWWRKHFHELIRENV